MGRVQTYSDSVQRYFVQDSLRRNSSFLILSQAINAGAAFLFWIICARLFTTTEVGIGSRHCCLQFAYFNVHKSRTPEHRYPVPPNKQETGRPFYLLALPCYFLLDRRLASIALLLIKFLVPKLGIVQSSEFLSLMLVLLIVGTSLSGILDSVLMSFRKGQYILWKALIINIPRLVLPIFVVSFGLRGIVSIYVVMLLLGPCPTISMSF